MRRNWTAKSAKRMPAQSHAAQVTLNGNPLAVKYAGHASNAAIKATAPKPMVNRIARKVMAASVRIGRVRFVAGGHATAGTQQTQRESAD